MSSQLSVSNVARHPVIPLVGSAASSSQAGHVRWSFPASGIPGTRSTRTFCVAKRSTSRTKACPRESGGVGSRRSVHTDAAGVFVPGRNHRLGNPTGAVLAAVKHADGRVLCRGAERGARPVRQARHLQYRSEPALAKAGGAQFTSDEFTQMLRDHGIAISMDGRGAATTTSSSSACGGP